MPIPNYQKISVDLIKNAENYRPGIFLNDNAVFDSVRQLCESPNGGLSFADATSNIDKSTRSKLIAKLKWVCDKANSGANAINGRIEVIKPLVLTSIGSIRAMFLGIVRGRPRFAFFNSALIVAVIFAIGFFYVLWRSIKKRNAELDISIKSSSLIEIAKTD